MNNTFESSRACNFVFNPRPYFSISSVFGDSGGRIGM